MIKIQLHSVLCNKSQAHLYKIVSNAKLWEDIFEPCQSVLLLSKDDDFEHVEICALIDSVPTTWRSKRYTFNNIFGVNAYLKNPMHFVEWMTARWRILPISSQSCIVSLEHEYKINDTIEENDKGVENQEQALRFIQKVVDCNSNKELIDLKKAAEKVTTLDLDNLLAHTV